MSSTSVDEYGLNQDLNGDQLWHLRDLQDVMSILKEWQEEQSSSRGRQDYLDRLRETVEVQIQNLRDSAREAQSGQSPPRSRPNSALSCHRSLSGYGSGSAPASSTGSGAPSRRHLSASPPRSAASSYRSGGRRSSIVSSHSYRGSRSRTSSRSAGQRDGSPRSSSSATRVNGVPQVNGVRRRGSGMAPPSDDDEVSSRRRRR